MAQKDGGVAFSFTCCACPEPVLANHIVFQTYGSQTSAVFWLCSYVGENRTVATIDNYTGEKTALFEPFIYKMHYFTKTGSGRT